MTLAKLLAESRRLNGLALRHRGTAKGESHRDAAALTEREIAERTTERPSLSWREE